MDETEVLNVIKEIYEKYKIILDPHSAIGFGALKKVELEGNNVVLATAHPCKFPDAIVRSINVKPSLPNELKHVLDEKENYDIISNNLDKIKKYIKGKI
jgi:threonine synthase